MKESWFSIFIDDKLFWTGDLVFSKTMREGLEYLIKAIPKQKKSGKIEITVTAEDERR